jgi:hypothetical protein
MNPTWDPPQPGAVSVCGAGEEERGLAQRSVWHVAKS